MAVEIPMNCICIAISDVYINDIMAVSIGINDKLKHAAVQLAVYSRARAKNFDSIP